MRKCMHVDSGVVGYFHGFYSAGEWPVAIVEFDDRTCATWQVQNVIFEDAPAEETGSRQAHPPTGTMDAIALAEKYSHHNLKWDSTERIAIDGFVRWAREQQHP